MTDNFIRERLLGQCESGVGHWFCLIYKAIFYFLFLKI
jgi:hypothetical protein